MTLNLPTDPALHPDEAGTKSPLRGVTRILRDSGMMKDIEVAEEILERGSDVHKACHYFDEGDLDFRMCPAKYRPYVRAWGKFKNDASLEIKGIEEQVESIVFGYRGRLDRRGFIRAKKGEAVIEIKTGVVQPFTRLQLAAYGYCLNPGILFYRFGVQLTPEGTYNVTEFPIAEYMDDVHTFRAAIRVINFRRKFNLGG